MSENQDSPKSYARAGVDIALAENLLDQVKPDLKRATRPESLGSIGGFGGFFDISNLKQRHPVLVSSTDSVGTKVTAARIIGDYRHLGADIVNHCANDIAVCGAEPLYFLDYYATGKLNRHYVTLMKGLARACREAGIALVGGETAELPGVYQEGECDLVGSIVGVVDKPHILTGQAIRPGDTLLGLASSGLHTNGFSLARKIIFEEAGLSGASPLPGFRQSVRTALLKPHVNYSRFLVDVLSECNHAPRASQRKGNTVFGAAHITGGGLTGNIPRILPDNCNAVINTNSWTPPPVFRFLVRDNRVSYEESHEVFNMGIGLVLIVDPPSVEAVAGRAAAHGHKASVIGRITRGTGSVVLEKGPSR
jgi:phosphoribosylformylglycinamidine cyclo-ligase